MPSEREARRRFGGTARTPLRTISVQKAAGCIVGKDYPKPIVDHGVVSKANIGRIKGAHSLGPLQAPDSVSI